MHMHHVHVTLRPGYSQGGPAELGDEGGVLASGGAAVNASGSLERVLSPRQTIAFERLVRSIGGGGAGGGTAIENHYHFPHYVGDTSDLIRALSDANRRGQLEVIKRR